MLIELKNISYSYEQSNQPVFKDLDFNLKSGDRIALMGPNGSGKTTLLKIIMGLLKPEQGQIKIFDQLRETEADFKEVREKIGFLFQEPEDQLFCPTVEEELEFGPLNLGFAQERITEIVNKNLKQLGISDLRYQVPWHLSGGEKKLVALGAVLAQQPEVLLLDEPFLGIDKAKQEQLITLLQDLEQSYVVISHHEELLAKITNSKYTMEGL